MGACCGCTAGAGAAVAQKDAGREDGTRDVALDAAGEASCNAERTTEAPSPTNARVRSGKVSGVVKETLAGAMEAMSETLANQGTSIRGSFRTPRTSARLKVRWGEEAHAVNSEYRKRRLSDQSLALVMERGPIHEAFESFMTDTLGGEPILRLWKALDEFDRRCTAHGTSADLLALRGAAKGEIATAAQSLYDTYFASGVGEDLRSLLSTTTLVDLKHDLAVDESGKVQQVNLSTVHDVFKVVHLRVHNAVKYEYLPGFLASEQFFRLATVHDGSREGRSDSSGTEDEAVPDTAEDGADSDDGSLGSQSDSGFRIAIPSDTEDENGPNSEGALELGRPRATSEDKVKELVEDSEKSRFFYEFIFMEAKAIEVADASAGSSRTKRRLSRNQKIQVRRQSHSLLKHLDVVELYLEIEDLMEPSADTGMRLRRFNRILARYGPPTQDLVDPPVETIQSLFLRFEIATGPATELPGDLASLFNPVKREILQRIKSRIVPAFKRSNTYRLMQLDRRHSSLANMQPSHQHLLSPLQGSGSAGKVARLSFSRPSFAPDPLIAALEREPLLQATAPPANPKMGMRRAKSEACTEETPKRGVPHKFSTMPDAAVLSAASSDAEQGTGESLGAGAGAPRGSLDSPAGNAVSTAERLERLTKFRDDVRVGPKHYAHPARGSLKVSLAATLSNSFGILQLKRFARRRFQEENVLFLVEVTQLRQNAALAQREDMYEVLHRAQSMCSQFVQPGSPLEVNISDEQRRETLRRFGDCSAKYVHLMRATVSGSGELLGPGEDAAALLEPHALANEVARVFDVAAREITGLVRKNLWEDFQDDPLFDDFVRKRGFCDETVYEEDG